MKLVTRDDIERWAETILSKGDLPYVISRLVRATTPFSTQSDFPSGSAAYIGGWDGEVICQEDTPYVPKGISLYEFGTEADCKGKADDDYEKRTANPLGYSPAECVFIFITPRFWKMKDKWVRAKKAEGIWKDIKVYDSSILEQWLDIAIATSRWFSSHIRSYPFDGIMTADEFWEEWSTGLNGLILQPEVITAGREFEQIQLLNTLQGQPSIKGIKASTKNEAIAFIIASAKQFPKSDTEIFFSKSLIIDTEGNFRAIRINTTTPLNLIPRFEELQPLYLAVAKGHHVLVPLGADDTFNQETIILPSVDRNGQVISLIKSGFSEENAEKVSKESGRNITILKKLLGFPHSKAKWLIGENIQEIIPALLLGRWNENFSGDSEIIEKLSGQKYSDYLNILIKWKNFEESPLIKIGETWRLTSPLDLWANLSPYLTIKDIQNLRENFLYALKNGNPVVEDENKNDFAKLYNKKHKFSSWSREGLTQSLILVGRFGAVLNIPNLPLPQLWVDEIINELLHNAKGDLWVSVNNELPLISEASPTSFLKAVSNSLNKEQPDIMEMFKEFDSFLHSTSNHTGLLWALEGLAWLPEYLREVSLILLKLSRLDPGGTLSNRPINSLSEIFKPWHYQTLTPFDERMEILKYLSSKEPEAAWTLLIRMLPGHRGIAHPTHKMRWRVFDKSINLNYTNDDTSKTHTYVIDLLLNLVYSDETKFAVLIEETANMRLTKLDRKKVFEWAEKSYSKVNHKEFLVWETLRRILNHHRSQPQTSWALPEAELEILDNLYKKVEPVDILSKYVWLFNEQWPVFPEGENYLENENSIKLDSQQKKIDEARKEAAKIFLDKLGLNKTLELRKSVKAPWALGDSLAKVVINENEIISVCKCLNDDVNDLKFIHSFIFRKSIIESFDWIKALYKKLHHKGFNSYSLANILIPTSQSKQLWDFISSLEKEVEDIYWHRIHPSFYNISDEEKVFGLKMFMKHRRFFTAIDICYYYRDTLSTELITDVLTKAATEESNEPANLKGYEIDSLFETLDVRNDLNHQTIINLEWLYITFLDSYGTKRNPKVLQEELSNSPTFFVEVLKWVYKPKEGTLIEEQKTGITDKIIENRARQAYHLLHSWKKIPGMKSDNSINEIEIKKWIVEARKLAEVAGRLEVADIHIGQILAEYPEDNKYWPNEMIFEIIEEINSPNLNNNYSSAMFNKRGFSSRGPFDGGNIERKHAKYFAELSEKIKNKYPNVSSIFHHLSLGYLVDAKRMDENAERDRLEY